MVKDAGKLWAEIDENRKKLDACPRHTFSTNVPGIEGGPAAMFGRKMQCLNCSGLMDLTHLNQYVRGYEAAGGDGNDILPGWR